MKKQNRNLPVEHYLVEAAAQELDEDCRVSLYEITCRLNGGWSVMLNFFRKEFGCLKNIRVQKEEFDNFSFHSVVLFISKIVHK